MWWNTWEMWGRGRFRKKRKSKQKVNSSQRKQSSYQTDSQYYIMAEPVELNALFQRPMYARKVYKRTIQPPTPSPSSDEKEVEEEDDDYFDPDVEVSKPYRQGRSVLHLDSKKALGLTPLPERSVENTPSPYSFSSPVPFSRSSSNYSLPRKHSFSLSAFLEPEDVYKPSSPGNSPDHVPSRPIPRSPVFSFIHEAVKAERDLEAGLPEQALDESPGESPGESPEQSPCHSPCHSPPKLPRTNPEMGPAYPGYARLDPEAGPSFSRPPIRASRVPDSFPTSFDSSEPPSSSSSSSSSSPQAAPPHSPKPKSKKRKGGRKAPFPYPGNVTSCSEEEDLSPVREHERLTDFEILNDPFKVCWIQNFIQDQQYLDDLINFVANGNYKKRDNDMFTYHQMEDETFMSNPLVQRLVTSLVQNVIPFLSKVVGKELNKEKVTISASKYTYTDHLLCHDDMSGDRRIAFIIYLNKKWERSWGGTLDLYRRDYLNDPGLITASIVPEFNRFLFFEVSAFSFHQVAEVINPDAARYTINGWFHYHRPIMQRGIYEPGLCQIRPGYVNITEVEFEKWIHKRWLGPKFEASKRQNYLSTRHEFLLGFLEQSMYNKWIQELQACEEWVEIGPPNRRKYEIIPETRLSGFLKEICRLLISEWMFKFVWRFTGRMLHQAAYEQELKAPGAPPRPPIGFIGSLPVQGTAGGFGGRRGLPKQRGAPPDPRCSILIRRWRKGFYTTALDDENEIVASRGRIVDVVITGGHTIYSPPTEGGYTCYVDRATGEEDYRYHPCGRNNTIHLNELSSDYYRYTKYINDKSTGTFYDIVMIFKE